MHKKKKKKINSLIKKTIQNNTRICVVLMMSWPWWWVTSWRTRCWTTALLTTILWCGRPSLQACWLAYLILPDLALFYTKCLGLVFLSHMCIYTRFQEKEREKDRSIIKLIFTAFFKWCFKYVTSNRVSLFELYLYSISHNIPQICSPAKHTHNMCTNI
jgi:hypothetical protein